MNRVLSILFLFIFVFGFVTYGVSETIEETFKKTVPAQSIQELSVENVNGSIQVESWDREEIEIIAYKRVRMGNHERAKELMEQLTIEIEETRDVLEVRTIYPRSRKGGRGFLGWLFDGGEGDISVQYEIRVPSEMDMDLESTNGGLKVSDCSGKIRLETTNGKIEASNISGSINAYTTNGSVRAELDKVDPKDDMSFKTTNGSIKVYLPEDVNADIEAHTTNGSIKCDFPMDRSYSRSKKHLEGSINDGGPLFYLKTTNGSINIYEN